MSKTQVAPTGCCYRIEQILKSFGYDVEMKFDRVPKYNDVEVHACDLKLLPFQKEAVEKALKYRYGIIQAPVRSGKTAIIGAIINKLDHHQPIWVITSKRDLVAQTQQALASHCGRKIGLFSESRYEPEEVIVSSYEALAAVFGAPKRNRGTYKSSGAILERNYKIKECIQRTEMLILDECHHSYATISRQWMREFRNVYLKIGLSGTPRKESLLNEEAAIGPIVNKVNYDVLVKEKRLAKPFIYIFDLPVEWYANFMSSYMDEYEANIVGNIPRNRFITTLVSKAKKKNKTVFVTVNRVAHGEVLRDLIPDSIFLQGVIPTEQRREVYSALQEKKLHCIIGTVGKEGLNLPSLDIVINAEGLKSQVPTVQKMRSLTASAGKKYGVIVDFIDHGPCLRRQSRSRLKIYQSITGAVIKQMRIKKHFFNLEGSRWLKRE
jgi:superfamily II DNA or RNA helicase